MQLSTPVDCNGLSPAPTILRIKQALIGRTDDDLPLNVLVDSDCDCERLADWLGDLAGDVHLASDIGELPVTEGEAARRADAGRRTS